MKREESTRELHLQRKEKKEMRLKNQETVGYWGHQNTFVDEVVHEPLKLVRLLKEGLQQEVAFHQVLQKEGLLRKEELTEMYWVHQILQKENFLYFHLQELQILHLRMEEQIVRVEKKERRRELQKVGEDQMEGKPQGQEGMKEETKSR